MDGFELAERCEGRSAPNMSPSSRQLNVQLEQIQQAQRMGDLFIGVLGHDLRHPLSSIVSGAALLELRPGDGEPSRPSPRPRTSPTFLAR
jgi:signal transduction histidine kinase